MMNEFDKTIFEYRKTKEETYANTFLEERIHGVYKKVTYPSKQCGYIDAYIYYPKQAKENYPVIFNFHGGGMVLGYCEQDGPYCRMIADELNCAVINVDYPIAPEFKYPIPIEASRDFVLQVLQDKTLQLDISNIFFMGHSAGGYLSCGLVYLLKDQLHINGYISNYGLYSQDSDMMFSCDLTNRIAQYLHWYFEDVTRAMEPLASPIYMNVEGFPPTLLIEAEKDPLYLGEQMFANKLREANIPVQEAYFEECMHGFTHAHLKEYKEEDAQRAWNMIMEFIRKNL